MAVWSNEGNAQKKGFVSIFGRGNHFSMLQVGEKGEGDCGRENFPDVMRDRLGREGVKGTGIIGCGAGGEGRGERVLWEGMEGGRKEGFIDEKARVE